MELSLLILVCIHKLYIIYLEIYVVLIDYGLSFFGHGKSMLKKRGHPVIYFTLQFFMVAEMKDCKTSTACL